MIKIPTLPITNDSLYSIERIEQFYKYIDFLEKRNSEPSLFVMEYYQKESIIVGNCLGIIENEILPEGVLATAAITIAKTSLAEYKQIVMLQSIETVFSIFEVFLCEYYKILLIEDNRLLISSEKSISYTEVVNHKSDIIEFITEKVINEFSYQSVLGKIERILRTCKLFDNKKIWNDDIKNKLIDINKLRQNIVHTNRNISITEDELISNIEFMKHFITLFDVAYSCKIAC